MKKVILVALILGLSGCGQYKYQKFFSNVFGGDTLIYGSHWHDLGVGFDDAKSYEIKGIIVWEYKSYAERGIKDRKSFLSMRKLFPLKGKNSSPENYLDLTFNAPYMDGIQKIGDALSRNDFSTDDLESLIETSRKMDESWLSPGGEAAMAYVDLLLSSASMVHKGESASSVVSKNIALEKKTVEDAIRRAEQDKKKKKEEERQDQIESYGRDIFNRCHGAFRSFKLPFMDQDGSTYTDDCLVVNFNEFQMIRKKRALDEE